MLWLRFLNCTWSICSSDTMHMQHLQTQCLSTIAMLGTHATSNEKPRYHEGEIGVIKRKLMNEFEMINLKKLT